MKTYFFTLLLPWLYHKTTIFQLCTTILYIFIIILIEKLLLYPTLCTQEISIRSIHSIGYDLGTKKNPLLILLSKRWLLYVGFMEQIIFKQEKLQCVFSDAPTSARRISSSQSSCPITRQKKDQSRKPQFLIPQEPICSCSVNKYETCVALRINKACDLYQGRRGCGTEQQTR